MENAGGVNDLSNRRKPKAGVKEPKLLADIVEIMEPNSQSESRLRTTLLYTNMTAKAVYKALLLNGWSEETLPTLQTISNILNRHGYRLRTVENTKVQKNPETDAIFENVWEMNAFADADTESLRISIDTKATVNMDNGPECSGRRTQFLQRLAEFADVTGLIIHLVYYPPYHSKYNAIERYWAGLEKSWNGYLLDKVETVLNRAGNFIWKGLNATVENFIRERCKTLRKRQSKNGRTFATIETAAALRYHHQP